MNVSITCSDLPQGKSRSKCEYSSSSSITSHLWVSPEVAGLQQVPLEVTGQSQLSLPSCMVRQGSQEFSSLCLCWSGAKQESFGCELLPLVMLFGVLAWSIPEVSAYLIGWWFSLAFSQSLQLLVAKQINRPKWPATEEGPLGVEMFCYWTSLPYVSCSNISSYLVFGRSYESLSINLSLFIRQQCVCITLFKFTLDFQSCLLFSL